MSFNVTSGTFSSSTATAATTAVNGGTSGIIVDNVVAPTAPAATSQVYFTPLNPNGGICNQYVAGFGGCAIQASQSALR